VSGDINGDGIADIEFFVVRGDSDPMASGDFIL
jgi:hypothetical protein